MKIGHASYDFTAEHGPLEAFFEIDGRVFATDRPTLDLLNYERDKGSLHFSHWVFAVNLATGRIKPAR